MRRREFITALGSAATLSVAWPLMMRAQQTERMRRIGVLMGGAGERVINRKAVTLLGLTIPALIATADTVIE